MELRNFTRREPVIKSLKFGLRPVGKTAETMKKNHLLEKDAELQRKCKELYPIYDAYVKTIVSKKFLECGNAITQELNEIYIEYMEGKQGKKEKKAAFDKMQKMVRKKFTNNEINVILQKGFLKDTAPKFVKEDAGKFLPLEEKSIKDWLSLLEDVNGCSTYLKTYATNRITSFDMAAKRVVENYFRFAENIEKLQAFLDYAKTDEDIKEEECLKELSVAISPEYYELCMTPLDIDKYNCSLKGIYNDSGIVKKGINQLINEANQKHRSDRSYNGPQFKLLNPLYQQILMPRDKQYERKKLENDEELNEVMETLKSTVGKDELMRVISLLKETDSSILLVSGKDLRKLSHLIFGDYNKINHLLQEYLVSEAENQSNSEHNKTEINIEKSSEIILEGVYSFEELTSFLSKYDIYKDVKIAYLGALFEKMNDVVKYTEELPERLSYGDKNSKKRLIPYFDAMTKFRHAVNLVSKPSERQDSIFFDRLISLTQDFSLVSYTNNLVLAYMTRKPKDMVKETQICFGNASKLDSMWWTGEKTMGTKDALILCKDGKYYFATKAPGNNGFTKSVLAESNDKDCYQVYLQKKAQPAVQRLPKITFSEIKKSRFFENNPDETTYILEKNMEHPVMISREAYIIKEKKLYQKTEEKDEAKRKHNLEVLIDQYKVIASEYLQFKKFTFQWKETSEYRNLNEFFADIDASTVHTEWRFVSAAKVDAAVESGALLMFLIWQRDLYKPEKKIRNAYVRLFQTLFFKDNMDSNELKLNSSPSISYRPAVIDGKITHPAGSYVVNRRTKDGEKVPSSIHYELYRYYNHYIESKESLSEEALAWFDRVEAHITEHDLIKDRRYAKEQFFLSISYTKNSKVKETFNPINQDVTTDMHENGYYTMAVCRGFEDLLYYEVFDPEKKMLEHGSLNKLNGTDYADYLKVLDEERKKGKSEKWEYDIAVKNIRHAYIEAAISEILKIAFRYNAVIVIEKLDTAYKQKWSCIDNQVFSTFEKKLETKLMDYHTPERKYGDPGSVENPIQAAYAATGEPTQNGILFRLNKAYTSNIDPYTGFVNLFSLYDFNGTNCRRKFLSKFTSIRYKDGFFFFHFDYKNFDKVKYQIKKSEWTVKAGGRRTKYNRSYRFDYLDENIAKNAEDAMKKAGLNNNTDFSKTIMDVPAYFVNALFDLFKTTLNLNIMKKCDKIESEYIISPIIGEVPEDKHIYPIFATTKFLAQKMWFYFNHKESDNYTQDWINFVQAHIE